MSPSLPEVSHAQIGHGDGVYLVIDLHGCHHWLKVTLLGDQGWARRLLESLQPKAQSECAGGVGKLASGIQSNRGAIGEKWGWNPLARLHGKQCLVNAAMVPVLFRRKSGSIDVIWWSILREAFGSVDLGSRVRYDEYRRIQFVGWTIEGTLAF
ncbi:uncharacterized protein EI90DRAFT_3013016 [Cantharellus anzutake]|uniref:uncharacterized protein n=1 Tax=Cantharellus anzutake TaxID=1750568 RepID=UPI001907E7C3|nr:uncharacterized protein EI90DRAFT_3013016 [Cantharellus anzutake]KAF8338885.1 hypothetical protein EI90DRAFT_3013016 [Cantharellus anzutake]